MQETYLSHPTFGLLYSLCTLSDKQALFTTLYAQRLFFRVTFGPEISPGVTPQDMGFEPISRNEARQLLEERIRLMRRQARPEDVTHLQAIFKQTFS